MGRNSRVRGVISLFMASILTVNFLFTGMLFDIALIAQARVNLQSGIRLAADAALAQFDKTLFREFGLYALTDRIAAQEAAELALEARNTASGEGFNPSRMRALSGTIDALNQEVLANPEVIEAQIDRMMNGQMVGLGINALISKASCYTGISNISKVLDAKFDYEDKLHAIKDRLDTVGKLVSVPPGMSTSAEDQLRPSLDDLERLASAILEPGDDREPSSLRSEFERIKAQMRSVRDELSTAAEGCRQAIDTLRSLGSEIDAMHSSYSSWGEAIGQMPASPVAASLTGDHRAQQALNDRTSYDAFAEELNEALKAMEARVDGLDRLKFGGSDWMTMDFDRFSALIGDRSETGTAPTGQGKLEALWQTEMQSSGKQAFKLSEAGERMCNQLKANTPQKRAGLLEFISAWNKRRKLVKQAKRAEAHPELSSAYALSDFGMTDEQKQRYLSFLSGKAQSDAFRRLPIGDSRGFLEEMTASSDAASALMRGGGIGLNEVSREAKLMGYWMLNFSDRMSPVRAAKSGEAPKGLLGSDLSARPGYGAEQEFILFGDDRFTGNLDKAKWAIAGLRLTSNMLYAFTSAQLRTETAGIAFAISGWSGFGVPIVQSILLGVMAAGETHLDMQALLDGESVPVYKTPGSWRFSLSGIRTLAEGIITDVYDRIELEASASAQALGDMLKEQSAEMRAAAIKHVTDSIRNPIDDLSRRLIAQPDMDEAQIRMHFDRLIADLRGSGGDGALGVAYDHMLDGLSQSAGSYVKAMAGMMREKHTHGGRTEALLQRVTNAVSEIITPLVDEASRAVDSIHGKWNEKLSSLRKGAEEKTQATVSRWLDSYKQELGLPRDAGGSIAGVALTMSYSDHLHLLMLMGSLIPGRRRAMLSHTARLAQISLDGKDLTTAPTGIALRASGEAPSYFIRMIGRLAGGGEIFENVQIQAVHERRYGKER